jgi:hypothetical protein
MGKVLARRRVHRAAPLHGRGKNEGARGEENKNNGAPYNIRKNFEL